MRLFVTALLVFLLALPAFSRTVTDALGRTLTLPDRVDRVIALSGALRFIVHIDAIDRVIATERIEQRDQASRGYTYAHRDRLSALPVVGEGGARPVWNMEAIVAAKPEVIFTAFLDRSGVEQLQRQSGTPVVALAYGRGNETGIDMGVFKESLMLAATITGNEAEAQKTIDVLEDRIADLKARTRGLAPKTVYIGGVAYKGAQGIESTQMGFLPFRWLSLDPRPDLDGLSGHHMIDRETILSLGVDALLIDSGGLNIIDEDVARNSGLYRRIAPLQSGESYTLLPNVFYGTNIDTLLANSYFLGRALYPDRFSDIDPVAIGEAIFRTLNHGQSALKPMLGRYNAFKRLHLSGDTLKRSAIE
jgi:iron complex transport system substrate-binding protein